jgi:hypothetical protein
VSRARITSGLSGLTGSARRCCASRSHWVTDSESNRASSSASPADPLVAKYSLIHSCSIRTLSRGRRPRLARLPRSLAVRQVLKILPSQSAIATNDVSDRVQLSFGKRHNSPWQVSFPFLMPQGWDNGAPCPKRRLSRRIAARQMRQGGGPGSSRGACEASCSGAPEGGSGEHRNIPR